MKLQQNKYYIEDKNFIVKIKDIKDEGKVIQIKKLLHHLIYPFYNLFYTCILLFTPKPKYDKKYKIVLCSIFKNEAPFFQEWIEYHQMIGIEHFYLYNNNSDDNYLEILKEYIDKGIITLTQWPEIPGQISSYKHWYDHYRNETQWVSFLDLDEYICPKHDTTINEWLTKFNKYPVIVMYWLNFGTSGHLKHDSDVLLIEQYIHCWNKNARIGKVFYNVDFDIAVFDNSMHHLLQVKWGQIKIPPYNDSKNIIQWSDIHKINKKGGTIQINHYWSRAYNVLVCKLNKGDSAYKVQWRTMESSLYNEYNNKSVNYNIHRFLLTLKLRLSKNKTN